MAFDVTIPFPSEAEALRKQARAEQRLPVRSQKLVAAYLTEPATCSTRELSVGQLRYSTVALQLSQHLRDAQLRDAQLRGAQFRAEQQQDRFLPTNR